MTPVPGLPYAHLNLRTNPFRELAPEERAAVAVVDVEPWVRLVQRRISGPGAAPARAGILVVQLLGPPGAGKTTHLDALHRHFHGAPRVEWSAPGRATARARTTPLRAAAAGWPPVPAGPLLFMDDAHAFPDRRWAAVLRSRRVLVAASHHDLAPTLRRAAPGRRDPASAPRRPAAGPDPSPDPLDVRTVSVADGSCPHRLRRIVRWRMEWARRGDGPVPKIGEATVVSLLARHGPDLRTVMDELYHHIQSHPPVAP